MSLVLPAFLVASSTHAAPAPPEVKDIADDANYLNDNSPLVIGDHPGNHNATPVGSEPRADILGIDWQTLKKKSTVIGYTVTMTLKGEPTKSGVLYRATAETADCSTLWLQYYSSKPTLTPQGSLRHTCDGAAAVLDGRSRS